MENGLDRWATGGSEASETAIKMFQVRGEGSLTRGQGQWGWKGAGGARFEPPVQRMIAWGAEGLGG